MGYFQKLLVSKFSFLCTFLQIHDWKPDLRPCISVHRHYSVNQPLRRFKCKSPFCFKISKLGRLVIHHLCKCTNFTQSCSNMDICLQICKTLIKTVFPFWRPAQLMTQIIRFLHALNCLPIHPSNYPYVRNQDQTWNHNHFSTTSLGLQHSPPPRMTIQHLTSFLLNLPLLRTKLAIWRFHAPDLNIQKLPISQIRLDHSWG